ncbi:hypothetical protein [Pedobacter sp. CFBP9032]|uniref:hypothetical protein n=1 Tax=Pedobacter sp. CFBP9032 TaxID=3096539 RepID=UPI002A6B106E|nr:hypothetical protein [Pedobacter sp. CFBP9032]MDY0906585.1 hypothetical protein [Pedobacter sp. CFBP9032]
MHTIKQFFNHEWVKNVSYSVIAGLILLFFTEVIFKLPILATTMKGIKYIGGVLALQIPVYMVLIAIVVISLTWRYLKERKNSNERLRYTADKFEHITWRWEWKYNQLIKRYEVKNAAPVCPDDECSLLPMISEGVSEEFGVYMWRCQDCIKTIGTISSELDIVEYVEKKNYTT